MADSPWARNAVDVGGRRRLRARRGGRLAGVGRDRSHDDTACDENEHEWTAADSAPSTCRPSTAGASTVADHHGLRSALSPTRSVRGCVR